MPKVTSIKTKSQVYFDQVVDTSNYRFSTSNYGHRLTVEHFTGSGEVKVRHWEVTTNNYVKEHVRLEFSSLGLAKAIIEQIIELIGEIP